MTTNSIWDGIYKWCLPSPGFVQFSIWIRLTMPIVMLSALAFGACMIIRVCVCALHICLPQENYNKNPVCQIRLNDPLFVCVRQRIISRIGMRVLLGWSRLILNSKCATACTCIFGEEDRMTRVCPAGVCTKFADVQNFLNNKFCIRLRCW